MHNKKIAKALVVISLILSFVVLLQSGVFFLISRDALGDQIALRASDSLKQAQNVLDLMASLGRMVSSQVTYDSQLNSLLDRADCSVVVTSEIQNRIDFYRSSNTFVQSLGIYVRSRDIFYLSSDYYPQKTMGRAELEQIDPAMVGLINMSDDPGNRSRVILRIARIPDAPTILTSYSFISTDNLFARGQAEKVIIANISTEWLSRINQGYTVLDNPVLFIDGQGRLMSEMEGTDIGDPFPYPEVASRIQGSSGDEGVFYFDRDGDSYLVVYSLYPSIGWYSLQIIPQREMNSTLRHVYVTSFYAFLFFLILALATSLLSSGFLRKPLAKMEENLDKLEREEASNREYRKRANLEEWIKGKTPLNHPWDYGSGKLTPLLAVQNLSLESSSILHKSSDAVRDEMGIALKVFFEEGRPPLIINLDRGCFLILLPDRDDLSRKELRQNLGKFQEKAHRNGNGSLSLFLGYPVDSHNRLPEAYQRLKELSGKRIIFNSPCLIDETMEKTLEDKEFKYSGIQEKRLLENLNRHDFASSKNDIYRIIEFIRPFSSSLISMVLSRLIFTLKNSLTEMIRRTDDNSSAFLEPLIPSLNEAVGIEEILDPFFQMIDRLEYLDRNTVKSSSQDVSELIKNHIDSHYHDALLSITAIADKLGFSPAYLTRVFRKHMNKTILEYIMESRMGEAERLLKTTDVSVFDIALSVGFSSGSYFHKVFRKQYGQTPTDFRNFQNPEISTQ